MTCKYSSFGCDIEDDEHEEKKPIKHLTLVNDEMRVMRNTLEQLTKSESVMLSDFSDLRTRANGILSREFPQLLWKVENWNEKQMAAKLRLEPWVLSPEFSSEAFGYRMISMVAPYGFDKSFGNAFSVFLQILPGQFDPLLKWPFDKKITITLYDQREQLLKRKNYQYELSCSKIDGGDGKGDGVHFRRPTGDKPNAPFGCELFCPLNAVTESSYVKDDSILIGIQVS
ncbi:hypothetical protein FO519_008792 [Halicephalobus sp. NKZ332]|nr:hypothetical protein FO519_008792 [Halicephalobus sp. NKZ332]